MSLLLLCHMCFFFFKQKTAYEVRISDWSSDVCSSDLSRIDVQDGALLRRERAAGGQPRRAARRPHGRPGQGGPRQGEIGRASCRERSVRVDLGGRRIIKKKKQDETR